MEPIIDGSTKELHFDSAEQSDNEFDDEDVVIRHPRRSSRYLLADEGDGAEADQLGTTPPRARIRDKAIRKKDIDTAHVSRTLRTKRHSTDNLKIELPSPVLERPKRAGLKLFRSRERDWKQEMSQRESAPESLPSPGVTPVVPTLVESCSRFMCLTSRLKSRESSDPPEEPDPEPVARPEPEDLPASRVNFHKTFSMLINMGNIEKGCRRTISREEQVWQNELKDLIWLELQAKIAGRTLAQQDAFLCAQRNIVPAIVQNIIDYRFVNPKPCRTRSQKLTAEASSREDLNGEVDTKGGANKECDCEDESECLSFNCRSCSDAIGKAMREVSTLLDSFYNAVSLYQSSKAMTVEHPLIATQLFKNRLKAMCLWYNTALHMRLKMLVVRRMMRTMRLKGRRKSPRPSLDSTLSRQSSEPSDRRSCQVRFNVSNNPTDSSSSDSSSQSDCKKETEDCREQEDEKSERNADEKGDEVDSVSQADFADRNGQSTPEIVISDSRYGTADTSASSESGYTSASNLHDEAGADVYSLGALDDITRLRLLGKCHVSPYREYHCEMLKTQGVRRCMMFINKLRKHMLQKVHMTLEKPHSAQPECFQEEVSVEVFDDTKDEEDKTDQPRDEDLETYELKRYGCWSEESLAMRLPSYRSHFLVLSSICMEAVHDYLSMRLEARPTRPSCLTVKQLIHELKEGLDISTEMRRDFVRNVEVTLKDRHVCTAAREELGLLLNTYDDTVETVLKQYLSYLITMSETEYMPRSYLQAEWAFTARLAKRVKCAAMLAPKTFCEISCNQITRLMKEFKNKFEGLVELEKNAEHSPNRYTAYVMCRAVQDIYSCWREPLLHAAQWARALAAKLARARPPLYHPLREDIFNKLMSMREFIVKHTDMVLEKTRVPDEELELTEGLVTRVRELLLQMFKLGFELHKELYKLVHATWREELIQRSRPASLQPLRPVARDLGLRRRRPDTIIVHESVNPMVHKELHRVVNDVPGRAAYLCSRRSIVSSPPRAARLNKLARSDSIMEDNFDKLFDNFNEFGDNFTEPSIERLLTGRDPLDRQSRRDQSPDVVQFRSGATMTASEVLAPVNDEREWAARVARAVIQFARCWMRFVVERCDRGRGLRPRWASQGLEFLMLACDPCNTKHLSEEEFEELKALMDGCISHVVGSRPAPARQPDPHSPHPHPHTPRPRHRLHSPSPSSPNNGSRDVPPPPTPPNEPDPLLSFHTLEHTAHRKRVQEAVRRLEEARDEKLQEMKAVGRVLGAAVSSYEPKLRQLTFKWQRGLKIGAGTFGKVYTVVNTESGQLLAMKELSIGAGDRRALQRAANELRVLEGVIHPHLVRYYGCELHREEMLLFMELCVEGSLEALVATSGALAEHTVRRYTKQLLSAVAELHARNIAHRDIKSGNIFLTNEGHCLKLGDFGCAVKIRANTTAPGELQGFVGTQAYMAPEVFMKSSGHGRAADIWSLGCVVTEMASGKRPFSEYDSNYQIMFVVGMGGRPEVPPSLSEEGAEFCLRCLTHDPDLRPRADQLVDHHFLMVKSDDDCKCEPAFLIT